MYARAAAAAVVVMLMHARMWVGVSGTRGLAAGSGRVVAGECEIPGV